MQMTNSPNDAVSVLYVDDEALSRKTFQHLFGEEFAVVSVASAGEALEVLRVRGHEFAVLVTDYRMPQEDGLSLLRTVQLEFRHLVRLLATAYAEKEVAIAAVNDGQVFRILEKPLEEAQTRQALRAALAAFRAQAFERALNEGRVAALRETLGFLAHELNTPLATVRGCVGTVAERYRPAAGDASPGMAQFAEHHPGELLAALERAERRALYCQSLISTFLQSARDAYPGTATQTVTGSSLVESLLDEYPFEDHERSWVGSELIEDFGLPGRRDLLYLVLCTLTKNALLALRGTSAPSLLIMLDCEPDTRRPRIRFVDNGPGIPAEVLSRLTREPVTTRAAAGGSGMGLMFCHRVMQSIGGSIDISSPPGEGAHVALRFRPRP